ncbi:unnamed protein product [Amoebophrya sp. A25]|nr:unnamed protein product [Amoebophrya sp. A25]|eukprot:GSA25T00018821001.1
MGGKNKKKKATNTSGSKKKNKQPQTSSSSNNGGMMDVCRGQQAPSAVRKNVNALKKEEKRRRQKEKKQQEKQLQNSNRNKNNKNKNFLIKTQSERASFIAEDDPAMVRQSAVSAEEAHGTDVCEILSDATGGMVYTLSRDKKIIAWGLEERETDSIAGNLNMSSTSPGSAGSSTASSTLFGGAGAAAAASSNINSTSASSSCRVKRWFLKKQNTIQLDYAIWCATFQANCLFVGLGNGQVKVFAKDTGDQFDFQAHTKRVTCIRRHAASGIVITGDNGGSLKCWQLEQTAAGQVNAKCAFETELHAEVKSFEVIGNTWIYVASAKGLLRLPLQGLESAKPEKLTSEALNALMPFEVASSQQTFLAAPTRGGGIQLFDAATGKKQHSIDAVANMKNVMTLGELAGERVICGHQDGKLSSFRLPEWTRLCGWRILDKLQQSPVHNVTCVRQIGAAGLCLVGLQNGALQLWRYAPNEQHLVAPAAATGGVGVHGVSAPATVATPGVVVGGLVVPGAASMGHGGAPLAPQGGVQIMPATPVLQHPQFHLNPEAQAQHGVAPGGLGRPAIDPASVPLPDDDDDDL